MGTQLKSRNDFAPMLVRRNLMGLAAEIGVAEGGFSFYLLDRWPGICYQIDSWGDTGEPGYSGHGTNDQDGRYRKVVDKANLLYDGRAMPLRLMSAPASRVFADGIFDFVYIDANHSLASAREDIALWWPKVKAGGILAGHDYLAGVFHGTEYGVKQAVDEFAAAHGLTVNVTQEPDWPSWWLEKP